MDDVEKPYRLLTTEQRGKRARWAAGTMRGLDYNTRNEAIAESCNVIDGRARFDDVRKRVDLARSYRGPRNPQGAA